MCMLRWTTLALFLAGAAAQPLRGSSPKESSNEDSERSDSHPGGHAFKDEFEKFLHQFGRSYNASEREKRQRIFDESFKKIKELNEHSERTNPRANRAKFGITKFADWTANEFRDLLGFEQSEEPVGAPLGEAEGVTLQATANQHAPCTTNWASRVGVRDQGQCGDCWAFSAAETLRAAHIRQHGYDPGALSTQFLVDCIPNSLDKTCAGGVKGCCGGNPSNALPWIRSIGGIPTQSDYGEVFGKGVEKHNITNPHGITWSGNFPHKPFPCNMDVKKTVTMNTYSQMKNENDMSEYVCSTGFLSIGVDATNWQHYTGGVMTANECGTNLDHAVVMVGIDARQNAWIVQNSWGDNWGTTLDGTPLQLDQYINCRELKRDAGCSGHITTGETIGSVCPQACEEAAPGGYIHLEYGQNTCGVSQQALAVTSTAASR